MSLPKFDEQIVKVYKNIITQKYPDQISVWPILSGYNVKGGNYCGWTIVILEGTNNPGMKNVTGMGELSSGIIGYKTISDENKHDVREKLRKYFRLNRHDAIFIFNQKGDIADDLEYNLLQHEIEMGLCPMKIFLSHKGADKPMVREFK